ncbi:MAG: acyl-CoA dehydrogenase family protein [Calditrichaeota bacterium]|nr:acyl-CoA dehydrogenase family protein [Candidatus Cloacimonadota bacterium]MCB1045880.1 acyl-CoA dehydrogenase family protein [Calditrichota bacterium]MCB9472591.1 acyl-CoA dehydrogenase family protein [Candidatus Delongbacteria bacterium]
MNFELNDDQKTLRDTLRKFAKSELNGDVIQRDRDQFFDRDLWRKMGEMAIPGLPVPSEYGGGGLSPLDTAIALEALGQGCTDGGLLFSLCAHMLPCTMPIYKFGTEEQRRKWLPGLCDGTLIAGNAMTEPGTGSDAFNMTTRAVRDGDDWVLNGNKIFITNAPVADVFVLFALTDPEKGYHGGVSCFIVPAESRGLSRSHKIEKMGIRTSPFGEVALEDVRVPHSAMLAGEGGGSSLFTHSMDWERSLLFAFHVGAMERLIETCVKYARTRQQFGSPITKFPAIREHMAEMRCRVEASRLLVYQAASRLEKSRSVSQDAAIAKLVVSESLGEVTRRAVQIHGGYGFTVEYEVERALRDAVGATLYSGTNEMMRNIIASWMGLGAGT